jgi:hypothetical protein
LITHLIVTRLCNLSCTYCFEHDDVSAPVALDVLKQRNAPKSCARTCPIAFSHHASQFDGWHAPAPRSTCRAAAAARRSP